MTSTLQDKVRHFPEKPGVYLMKDAAGRIIYVGKANVLKKRVSSYFQSRPHPSKVVHMMGRVDAIDYLVTGTELEALLLESNLIKRHRPRYNILLRDDKHYPYLKLTVNEDWPRLLVVRRVQPDGSKYFGPYTGGTVRQTLRLIKRLFKIRWCKETPLRMRDFPCIEFHIKRCDAPCIANLTKRDYGKNIQEIESFLEGKFGRAIEGIHTEMQEASARQEYERAAILRDRLRHLEELASEQKVLVPQGGDRDVFAYVAATDRSAAVILNIRDGKLVHREVFYPKATQTDSAAEVVSSLFEQYYTDVVQPPPEILVNQELPDVVLLRKMIEKLRGKRVEIVRPSRGEKASLVELAEQNAWEVLHQKIRDRGITESGEALLDLREKLGLPKIPERIEGFDISNFQGSEIVGSMVSFVDGEPFKDHYRKFRVSVSGRPNDVASIFEVVSRRYGGSLSETLPRPDLILIDGGIGQVRAAEKALRKIGWEDANVFGLAKRLEEIYRPSSTDPIRLSRSSPALKLLQRVRDEAHRFAVSYHRLRRGKALKA